MARSPTSASQDAAAPAIAATDATVPRPRSRLRRMIRQGLPVVGVVIVVVLVAVIAYVVYTSNRRGAVTLSNDLITAIDRRVGAQMRSYLTPPQQFLSLADAAAAGRGVIEAAPEVERFARHAITTIGSVSAFSYADPQGNFLFVIRNEKGGFDTKLINRHEGHRVTWERRDGENNTLAIEEDPGDTYDPRTRPWYQGAESTRKPFWTETYLFFTLKKPGLTLAVPHFDADGKLQSVMGVDIELASLCAYLAQLNIGNHGKALIIDADGRIIAYPDEKWLPASDPEARAPRLDEVGDPVLTRAYDLLRVEGYGRKVLNMGDERIIVSSEPVRRLTGRDWVVLIVVPETDFVGFVADSGVTALIMSIAVVLIVAALTGMLAWRNVLAERRATTATTRQHALELRTQTFIDLAHDAVAADADEAGLARATESAATACAAKRVAIWRLSRDGRTLTCEDCFDSTVHDHTMGLALHRDEMPNLFAALAKGAAIDTAEAGRDKRTSELFANYLQPLEISSVYITPIAMAGRLMGMMTVEDPRRGDHATGLETFCDALSILLALRFTAAAAPTPGAQATVVAAAAQAAAAAKDEPAEAQDSFAQRQTRLERTLLAQNAPMESLIESAIDRAAIGVIKLPNWTTVAQRPSDTGQRTAMDAIIQELRRSIETSGVCYAALLDDQIVLAAFLRDRRSVEGHAECMAAAMLELRDRLIELEDRWGTSLDFRLAIDIGTVMASTVGTDPPSRNLWGGAIGVAKVLAGTTSRRTIAASETAYDLLSTQYLFRPRGSYFLPETGNMRTFVMVGRI
jgi:adenylate cyclase